MSAGSAIDLIGPDILINQLAPGQVVPSQVAASSTILEGKYVALLFSKSYVPSCFRFTPKLRDIYEAHVLAPGSAPFEVVLCSSDTSQDHFDKQFSTMPWAALPFGSPRVEDLARRFKVPTTLPVVVILTPDGECLSTDARPLMLQTGAAGFPWKSPAVTLGSSKVMIDPVTMKKLQASAQYLIPLLLVAYSQGYLGKITAPLREATARVLDPLHAQLEPLYNAAWTQVEPAVNYVEDCCVGPARVQVSRGRDQLWAIACQVGLDKVWDQLGIWNDQISSWITGVKKSS